MSSAGSLFSLVTDGIFGDTFGGPSRAIAYSELRAEISELAELTATVELADELTAAVLEIEDVAGLADGSTATGAVSVVEITGEVEDG